MTKSKLFKGIALINSICLLSVFLLFKNGLFDDYINSNSQNTGIETNPKPSISTTKIPTTSTSNESLPTSNPNPAPQEELPVNIRLPQEDKTYMSSSKSITISEFKDLFPEPKPKKVLPDSFWLKRDK